MLHGEGECVAAAFGCEGRSDGAAGDELQGALDDATVGFAVVVVAREVFDLIALAPSPGPWFWREDVAEDE